MDGSSGGDSFTCTPVARALPPVSYGAASITFYSTRLLFQWNLLLCRRALQTWKETPISTIKIIDCIARKGLHLNPNFFNR
jgi:hypothetical protein